MKRAAVAALALVLVGLPVASSAGNGLTGAIYRGDPSASGSSQTVTAATASAGSQVYVRPRTGGAWIGPASTDLYGRFVFAKLQPGTYQLRAYAGSVRLWDEIVTVPTVLPSIVVRDVTVAYYVKPQDSAHIADLLGGLSFPYELRRAEFANETNTLWYGDSVKIADIKTLAARLVGANVQLRAIRRFKDGTGIKAKLIEIGASSEHVNDPPLTIQAINVATTWPRAM